MIHFHGTPITPREQLLRMAGRHFCVSFAADQDRKTCLQIGQSVMFDNGAFSAFTRGAAFDEEGYYRWLEPHLAHPHFAVIPDVIDGTLERQRELIARWPFHASLGAPVWHLAESLDHLRSLIGAGRWPRVCFGSSGAYWDVGSSTWCTRMDEAFNAIERTFKTMPWIHGLRMLGQTNGDWPLASADSTNVAQNWKRDVGCAECKAAPIDARQTPARWAVRETQQPLFT